ncbi:hypothetical protein BDR26DRAFT_921505 [Obelidium mucronatum]|nr:hypothetical protein BDR26DRAFT_921505 [Obelidium mucronatum]
MKAPTVIGFHRCIPQVPYSLGLQLQQKLVAKRLADPSMPNMMLLLQHTPVYTAGRRLKGAASAEEALRIKNSTGLDLFETSRGGQTTFHGPGQLVGYPVLDLRTIQRRNLVPVSTATVSNSNNQKPAPVGTTVRGFVAGVEDAIISACSEFGVKTNRTVHTGVWVNDERKVAALGIQVSRYITSHGFALNCNVDLKYFDAIIPCGLEDKQATSLTFEVKLENPEAEDVTLDRAIPAVARGFNKAFDVDMVPLSTIDAALSQEIDEFLHFGKEENPFFFCI